MQKVIAGLLMLFSPVSIVTAGGLDLSLSSDTAYLSIQFNPFGAIEPGAGAEFSVGYLINENDDDLYNATLLARGVRQTDFTQYKIGAGFRLVGGELKLDETLGALALGFQASILLAPSQYNPVDLIVEGFFAPSISSFADAEEYTELSARLQIDVIPQARAFIGYRRIAWDTNDFPNVVIDRSAHVGLSITF